MIKLRDYQERQFEYIKGKIDGKSTLMEAETLQVLMYASGLKKSGDLELAKFSSQAWIVMVQSQVMIIY